MLNTPLKDARFVVSPLPYEATYQLRQRHGHGGPTAIFDALSQVELYDDELRSWTYRRGSIHIDVWARTCLRRSLISLCRPWLIIRNLLTRNYRTIKSGRPGRLAWRRLSACQGLLERGIETVQCFTWMRGPTLRTGLRGFHL